MADINGTSRAQTKFLRSFRSSKSGPRIDDWPSPAILRRWLRRPGFVKAMQAMQTTLTYQADFQLLSASASATHLLHSAVNSGNPEARDKQMKALRDLLKIAHLRQRFTAPPPKPRQGDCNSPRIGAMHLRVNINRIGESDEQSVLEEDEQTE